MRKVSCGVAAGVVALIVTSVAVAHGGSSKSVSAVAATFSATAMSDARTTTCTNADGSWTRVDATYTGTATGDPALTGAATLSVRALINTTKNLGTVSGKLSIGDTKLGFETVYSGGKVAGLAEGRAHGTDSQLLANISAIFGPT